MALLSVYTPQALLLLFGTAAGLKGVHSRDPSLQFRAPPAQLNSTGKHAWQVVLRAASSVPARTWNLRICNAYAFESGLDVLHAQAAAALVTPVGSLAPTTLTGASGPLPYRHCAELQRVCNLGPGSLLSFRLSNGLQVGCFRVTALPAKGSLLQLVVHRRDSSTTAAAFSSHVFQDSSNPEMAVVDAYQGTAHSKMAVRGWAGGSWQSVPFGTAVTMKPGLYEWLLSGSHARSFHGGEPVGIWMRGGGQYTVIRVGIKSLHGPSYREELVMFPTDWASVYSLATHRASACTPALVLWLGLLLFQQREAGSNA